MKTIICLFVSAVLVSGCMSERKRAEVFHAYARENRSEVLEYCPEPIKEVRKGKTVTITKTDTVRVSVPYEVPGTNDTVWVDCPESETVREYIFRTDTLFQENSAALEAAMLREQQAREDRVAAETQADIFKKQATNRLWLFIGGIVVAVAAILFRVKSVFGL